MCLICTRYIFHLAICQLRHRGSVINNYKNIKVCVLRGLSHDFIKVWNWGFHTYAQLKNLVITWSWMVTNFVSSNLEPKFKKRHWIEVRPGAGFLAHNSAGILECLREWKPGIFSFFVFLIMWNHLDIICNHLVFTGSYPLIF